MLEEDNEKALDQEERKSDIPEQVVARKKHLRQLIKGFKLDRGILGRTDDRSAGATRMIERVSTYEIRHKG